MDFLSFRSKPKEAEYDDPRRAFLVRALTLGAFAAGGPMILSGCDWSQPVTPNGKLPAGRSVYHRRGEVLVDGAAATRQTKIGPDARIETGSDSQLAFAVGKDAFMIRENSKVQLSPSGSGDGAVIAGIRAVTGKLLSVFGERAAGESLSVDTPTATVGIRGTGLYIEAATDRTYACTCYGTTELRAGQGDEEVERITAEHHDAPRYILSEGAAGKRILQAPVINHTDMELVLLEHLVGREPPFDPADRPY